MALHFLISPRCSRGFKGISRFQPAAITVFFLILFLGITAAPVQSEGSLEVSLLARGKNVTPLVCRYQSLTVTDIKLPDLVLTNRSDKAISSVEIEIVGLSDGKRRATFYLGNDQIGKAISTVNPQIKAVLTRQADNTSLKIALGDFIVDKNHLTDGSSIKPGECAVVLLSKLLYVHCIGADEINAVDVIVKAQPKSVVTPASLHIPLTHREYKSHYVFPIRGNVQIINMPLNYQHHRQAHSQEFAIDILLVHPDKDGKLMTSKKTASATLSDYYIYHQEVLAVADGEVVKVADGFPENETVSPATWSTEASKGVSARLGKTIGAVNALAGNYVIIKHAPNVFGFYAHLSQHSMKVEVGDKVRAGQAIALAGSTGNSSEPHLHFQLMDSEDFTTANGLPMIFSDLPTDKTNQYLTGANSLAASDYLTIYLPPAEAHGKH